MTNRAQQVAHELTTEALETIHGEFSVLAPEDREAVAKCFGMTTSTFDISLSTAISWLNRKHN